MANLNEYRTEFRKYHNQIIRNNLAKTDAYFSEDIYSTFDEAYLAAFAEIQTAIDQLTPALQELQIPITTTMIAMIMIMIQTTVVQSQLNWNAIYQN